METKKWYLSKVLWVNAIAFVGVITSKVYGYELSADETASILALINIVLRGLTKQPLS